MRKNYYETDYARRNTENGHAKRREAFAAHNGELPRRPDAGTPLKTIHVTDHITAQSYTLEIVQGERKNGIDVFRFGARVDCGGSFDGLFRMLRRNWALKWLTA